MNKAEIIEMIESVYSLQYSEEEDIEMLNKLHHCLPHAKIVNLMFHDSRGLTPEQIADEAIQKELNYISQA